MDPHVFYSNATLLAIVLPRWNVTTEWYEFIYQRNRTKTSWRLYRCNGKINVNVLKVSMLLHENMNINGWKANASTFTLYTWYTYSKKGSTCQNGKRYTFIYPEAAAIAATETVSSHRLPLPPSPRSSFYTFSYTDMKSPTTNQMKNSWILLFRIRSQSNDLMQMHELRRFLSISLSFSLKYFKTALFSQLIRA